MKHFKKMINMDRRFAIVIGINDYDVQPLNYCVDDAKSVIKILENKCAFRAEDIYQITSSKNEQIKDITGKLEKSIGEIKKSLKPSDDSIFFYFAGHGKYQFENSGLKFHDSYMEIYTIFEKINELQPKYQCYVIDACESGGKVITRGESSNEDIIKKYISKGKGILFMYASTEEEKARELSKIKHGLFTYHFLKAINEDENYDKEGILTPNRIHDYISRETSKESDFKQTPVIENRTIGYYPFAFKDNSIKKQKEHDSFHRSEKTKKIDEEYFPEIPSEIRNSFFTEIKPEFEDNFKSWVQSLNLDNYDIEIGNNLSIFGSKIQDKLTDKIVEKSRNENVEAVNFLFSTEREEIKPNPLFSGMGMIEAMINKNKPKYKYYNRILWGDERIIGVSANFKSKNIYNTSCGIVIILYQAIFGIGLANASYYLAYTGYGDTQINGPFTGVSAYKYHRSTKENILKDLNSELKYFESVISDWNEERRNKINEFNNKSK